MKLAMAPDKLRECLHEASKSPMADPSERYPYWYLHRWHFLPEGYLSHRSVRIYQRLVPKLYYAGQEARVLATMVRDVVRAQPPQRIIDLGCGDGKLIAAIAAALPDATITGFDLSPFLLERAAELTKPFRDRVRLIHRNIAGMTFAPASADLIVATHFLGHIPPEEADAVARAALRALAPGARLATIDHAWHPLPLQKRPTSERQLAGDLLKLRVYEA